MLLENIVSIEILHQQYVLHQWNDLEIITREKCEKFLRKVLIAY